MVDDGRAEIVKLRCIQHNMDVHAMGYQQLCCIEALKDKTVKKSQKEIPTRRLQNVV